MKAFCISSRQSHVNSSLERQTQNRKNHSAVPWIVIIMQFPWFVFLKGRRLNCIMMCGVHKLLMKWNWGMRTWNGFSTFFTQPEPKQKLLSAFRVKAFFIFNRRISLHSTWLLFQFNPASASTENPQSSTWAQQSIPVSNDLNFQLKFHFHFATLSFAS